MYPSEGIHRRWDKGFRITCCAATLDRRLSSSAFRAGGRRTRRRRRCAPAPSAPVKEKWAKNLYISAVAFGRTVS